MVSTELLSSVKITTQDKVHTEDAGLPNKMRAKWSLSYMTFPINTTLNNCANFAIGNNYTIV